MARRRKNSFGKKLLFGILEIALAIAILAFVVQKLPEDFSVRTLVSNLSQSLFITKPEDGADPVQPGTAVTPAPQAETGNEEEQTEVASTPLPDADMGDGDDVNDPTLPEGGEDSLPGDVLPDDDGIDSAEEPNDIAPIGGEQTEVGDDDGDEPDFADVDNTVEPDAQYDSNIFTGDVIGAVTDDGAEGDSEEEETLVSNARKASITISAAGDCTLGGDTTNGSFNRFKKMFTTNGEGWFFRNVKEIFEKDDITIVNLEGALTKATTRKDKTFSFRGEPAFGKILTEGSVEVVSLDNNHSQDYYSQGTADTKKVLTKMLGIGYAGLGESYTMMVDGINVGFLSYRIWEMSTDSMVTDIQTLKQDCDLVIVSLHWGEEKVGKASKDQIKLAHAAVDAGADLILGHHPHVVGPIELYKDKYIVYSLANFCFGGNSNPKDKDTFIFQQTFNFENGEIVSTNFDIIPCSVSSIKDSNNYQPTPLAYDKGGLEIIKRIYNLSQQFEDSGTMPDFTEIRAKAQKQ